MREERPSKLTFLSNLPLKMPKQQKQREIIIIKNKIANKIIILIKILLKSGHFIY